MIGLGKVSYVNVGGGREEDAWNERKRERERWVEDACH
mgnify:CR=1 FL=1